MSASPAPTDEGAANQQGKKIAFRFCRECSNLLYPKEDKDANRLMFACRTCQYAEPAPNTFVYRNDLSNAVGETAGITQDVGSDPTVGPPSPALSHTTSSTNSNGPASASSSPARAAAAAAADDDDAFATGMPPEFCTLCGDEIVCEICGQPTEYGCFLEVLDEDGDVDMDAGAGFVASSSSLSAPPHHHHQQQQQQEQQQQAQQFGGGDYSTSAAAGGGGGADAGL